MNLHLYVIPASWLLAYEFLIVQLSIMLFSKWKHPVIFNVPSWQNGQKQKSAKTANLEDTWDSMLVKRPIHFNRERSKIQVFDMTSQTFREFCLGIIMLPQHPVKFTFSLPAWLLLPCTLTLYWNHTPKVRGQDWVDRKLNDLKKERKM